MNNDPLHTILRSKKKRKRARMTLNLVWIRVWRSDGRACGHATLAVTWINVESYEWVMSLYPIPRYYP